MEQDKKQLKSIALDDHADQVIVLHNPCAGAISKPQTIEKLTHELEYLGLRVQVFSDVERAIDATQRAIEQTRLRTVVAAGGDGTAALVANRFGDDTPITLFPMGTENLLSKYLGIRLDVKQVARMVKDGLVVRLDAAQANGRLFLIMASCGFDADVVRRMHNERQGHVTYLSYFKPFVDSIRKYRYPSLFVQCYDVDSNQKLKPIKAKWAFCFNVPQYALGLPIVESAIATDGKLDVCTFRQGNLFNGVVYFFGILMRRHRRFKDTSVVQVKRVIIESDKPVPYQLDGDPGGYLPLEIQILPRRLCLVVSPHWASANGCQSEFASALVKP